MRSASILLILYATAMLSYGALEMGHDFLHYLAEHHHSELHNHEHDHHHSFHDHEHKHDHDDHSHMSRNEEPDEKNGSQWGSLFFFLFIGQYTYFTFYNSSWQTLSLKSSKVISRHILPITPPPETSDLVY